MSCMKPNLPFFKFVIVEVSRKKNIGKRWHERRLYCTVMSRNHWRTKPFLQFSFPRIFENVVEEWVKILFTKTSQLSSGQLSEKMARCLLKVIVNYERSVNQSYKIVFCTFLFLYTLRSQIHLFLSSGILRVFFKHVTK